MASNNGDTEMTKFKKTVCLDFDGVVHSYTSPWTGPRDIPDPIVKGAIEFILTCLVAGWAVVIFSTRSHHYGGQSAMLNWLEKESGLCWHDSPAGPGTMNVTFPKEKPPAILYIDDRGYHFEGTFPTIKFMENFKPWNKKPIMKECPTCHNANKYGDYEGPTCDTCKGKGLVPV